MLAAERRPRNQILAPREPADQHRLEADLADEAESDRDRVRVVASAIAF